MRKSTKPKPSSPQERLVFERDGRQVWHGDCLAWLAAREPGRFSTCVTDPPYELGFMGRKWDKSGVSFDPETWRAILRALKPGAHLVAFGGTRTFHRLACAIEDAGFEIRDCLMWIYGSGFPKSLDVSKAIDKKKGAKRKKKPGGKGPAYQRRIGNTRPWMSDPDHEIDGDDPVTPEAARWQGWGTGLKPAWEPIILARKPLDGTVAECVLRHGTGALNVDATRIGSEKIIAHGGGQNEKRIYGQGKGIPSIERGTNPHVGRWPPNAVFQHDARCVCVSEDLYACVPGCPVRMLDGQSGVRMSGSRKPGVRKGMGYHGAEGVGGPSIFGSSGSVSRFFYTPKASTAERSAGLSMLESNLHPTVKPVALMEWLLRLVVPPGEEVLDPFAGSGSTLVAAKRLGVPAVGIDLDAEACDVAAARLTRRTAKGIGGVKKLRFKKRRSKR